MAPMEDRTSTGELIPIGRFARLSGLSIGALRHYDELDLLRPADVDRFTGYRRYRPDQLDIARAIGRLRDLEVPIEEIREVLAADDPADQRRRIGAHERRLQARADRLGRLLHRTRQLSHGKEPLVTTGTSTAIDGLDEATHRQLAKDLFNHTWTLIEKSDRTPAENDEMIHSTHASAFHWSRGGGTLANAARGEWQVARVYSTLGRGEPALHHAECCLETCLAHPEDMEEFDLPYAYEALARAYAAAGNDEQAHHFLALARQTAERIEDADDREVLLADLETIPVLTLP